MSRAHEKIPELVDFLPEDIERVRAVVRKGDETAGFNAYTSDFTRSHRDNCRKNLITLTSLYAEALTATGNYDKAIAQLGGMKTFIDQLGDNWSEDGAGAAFDIAWAYALRAAAEGNKKDIENAVQYLRMAITGGALNAHADWDEIKSDTFKGVWDDPAYKELIRGR